PDDSSRARGPRDPLRRVATAVLDWRPRLRRTRAARARRRRLGRRGFGRASRTRVARRTRRQPGVGVHLGGRRASGAHQLMADFKKHPDPSQWEDFTAFESTSWPKKDRKRYWIIPSICFNCESACGILAYVDKETLEVRKVEGNPVHPGSRGRTCA